MRGLYAAAAIMALSSMGDPYMPSDGYHSRSNKPVKKRKTAAVLKRRKANKAASKARKG